MTANLSTPAAARAVGVTFRQLDHWVRRGYLLCEGAGGGHGHPRAWTAEDVDDARRFAALVHAGFTVEAAHTLVDRLEAHGPPVDLGGGLRLSYAPPVAVPDVDVDALLDTPPAPERTPTP